MSRLSSERYRASFGEVTIYKDPTLDWYKSINVAFANSGTTRRLDSNLLYFGPRSAESWRQRSQTVIVPGNLRAQYELAVSRFIVPNFGSGDLTLVDLGVGDFCKGYIILEKLLRDSVKRVNYIPYDISYEMITSVLDTQIAEFKVVLQEVLERHSLFAINAEFDNLPRYLDVFPPSGRRCFGLFGNTLGTVDDHGQLLESVRNALSDEDVFVAELQLLEPNPPSEEELLRHFEITKRFYLGPFLALGCQESHLQLRVRNELSSDFETVNVICSVESGLSVAARDGKPALEIPEGEFVVLQIRKYIEGSLSSLYKRSGLEIIDSYCTVSSKQGERAFAYIAARKCGDQFGGD